jgi:hypothetical protein
MEDKKTKNILLYESLWDSIQDLSNEEIAELFIGISNWREGIEPVFTQTTSKILFRQQLPLLEKQSKNYQTKVENGRRGGAPQGNQNALKQPKTTEINQEQPTTTENKHIEKEKEKEKDIEKDNNNKKSNISSGKEVLAEKPNSLLQSLQNIFIQEGFSHQEAIELSRDYMKLKTDEEIQELLNLNSNGLSQVK